MEQYFTPSLQDIRVGYECEIAIIDFSSTGGKPLGWKKYIIGQDMDVEEKGLREMSQFVLWNTGGLRVPYLTKEPFEKEGWKDVTHPLSMGVWKFEKTCKFHDGIIRTVELTYNFITKKLLLSYDCGEFLNWGIFDGFCNDINTFRDICKLLNIK